MFFLNLRNDAEALGKATYLVLQFLLPHQLAQNLKDSQCFKYMAWRWQGMASYSLMFIVV